MRIVRKILKKIILLIPLGNYILFESIPDMSDNPKAVFDWMRQIGLHKKYKLIWYVSDQKKGFPRMKRVKYIDESTRFRRFMFKYYKARAKCVISCNRTVTFLPRFEKQKAFYLTHGTTLKSIRSYYNLPKRLDYILVASENSKSMMAYELNVDESKVVALGFPRNDVLTAPPRDLHGYFNTEFKKIIVWYPTYRQHRNGAKTNAKNALPVLHDTEAAIELNAVAKKHDTLIVMKPHFAQDISYIKDFDLSNICFIGDDFFVKNGISSYEFIAACDALITDYSSVYYDYLLCDKPVALVWEDVDEYRENPGFAGDLNDIGKAAEKIYTLEDFKTFVIDLANGVDRLRNERQELCRWANYATDGKNTERVTDFIIEKANL